jgi:hypothetical protein
MQLQHVDMQACASHTSLILHHLYLMPGHDLPILFLTYNTSLGSCYGFMVWDAMTSDCMNPWVAKTRSTADVEHSTGNNDVPLCSCTGSNSWKAWEEDQHLQDAYAAPVTHTGWPSDLHAHRRGRVCVAENSNIPALEQKTMDPPPVVIIALTDGRNTLKQLHTATEMR